MEVFGRGQEVNLGNGMSGSYSRSPLCGRRSSSCVMTVSYIKVFQNSLENISPSHSSNSVISVLLRILVQHSAARLTVVHESRGRRIWA
jgi:hypothetical protein